MRFITRRSLAAVLASCVLSALVVPSLSLEPAPKPAPAMLDAAKTAAGKQHKNVLVMFHASWCGWCHKLEAVMNQPDFKKMFVDNYILLNLDVMENGPKVAELENPGGKELMTQLGGEKSGLPFYAFLDAKGKKLADSNAMPKNMNIGYPGEPGEIDAFMDLIKKTAPHWSAADLKTLHDYLVANAPKSTIGTAVPTGRAVPATPATPAQVVH